MTSEIVFLFQLVGTFWLLLEMRSRGRRLGQALLFMRTLFAASHKQEVPLLIHSEVSR